MKHSLTILLALCLSALPTALLAQEEAPTIAVYDLEGMISEGGQEGASLLAINMNAGRPLTHFDLVQSLTRAASDEAVRGVALDLDQAGIGLAQVQELRRLLLTIREAGKDVWLYTDSLNIKTALIGSAANHFSLMPEGDVSLTGLYNESLYFKGLFDKIGVEVDVVHIGDYKSAGETLSRTGPSEAAQQQSEALLNSLWDQMIAQISAGRKIERSQLQAFINSGFRTPEQALEAKLVDALHYRTDFITTAKEHYGEEASFDRSYELPNTDAPEMDSLFDLFSLMFSAAKKKRHKNDYLAVVVLDAAITNDSIAPVRREILKATKNAKCKGLVLRVNSPGGSALASEVLWEATDQFKATERPFVVSMGGVAASGGYYVAAGADRIFAEEGTITGSIGVVGMKLALGGAMENMGITTHETKRGAHADIMNSNRPFSEREKTLVRNSMLDVYRTFKKRVSEGRGDRLKDELEALAGGRVYSGQRALELGLVDEIGGLHEAILYLTKKAELENLDVQMFPEPKDPFVGLFADPTREQGDEFITMHKAMPPAKTAHHYLTRQPALQLLGPAKQRALRHALTILEAAQSEHVLLLAPAIQTSMTLTR